MHPMATTGGPSTAGELKRMVSMPSQWVVLYRGGDTAVVDDVDRYEIMRRFHVHARDLRVLDPLLSSYPSAILGRGGAIILNIEHVKSVITREFVLLRDPSLDNLVPLVEELRRRALHDEGLPFELRALEAELEGACSALDARATELELEAYPVLDELTARVSSRGMDRTRRLKGTVARLAARARKVRDELERLLDDDQGMAELCLSKAEVDQVEMVLETYYTEIDETMGRVKSLRRYIEATEELVNLQLDNRRNRLIEAELLINSGTVCLALYSLVAGMFGMSIRNPWWGQDYAYVFKWVVAAATMGCCVLYVAIMGHARRKGLVRSCFFI